MYAVSISHIKLHIHTPPSNKTKITKFILYLESAIVSVLPFLISHDRVQQLVIEGDTQLETELHKAVCWQVCLLRWGSRLMCMQLLNYCTM